MVNNSRIPMSTMSGDCRGNTYTKIETIQPLCKNDMQICEPSMFKKIYIYIYLHMYKISLLNLFPISL